MKFKERINENYERLEKPVRELFSKLTRSQKISLALFGGTVLALLVTIIVTQPGKSYEFSIPDDTQGVARQILKDNEIPFDARDQALYVADEEQSRVLSLAIVDSNFTESQELFSWLFKDANWGESSGQRREKLIQTTRRRVELALAQIPEVDSATVVPNIRDESLFVASSNPSTASVKLESVGRVSMKNARAIRRFVAFSFGLREQNVSIMDSQGPLDPDGSMVLDENKRNAEKDYQGKIVAHLSASYSPRDFVATVDVSLNRQDEKRETKRVLPEDSHSLATRKHNQEETSVNKQRAPGVAPNVAEISKNSPGVELETSMTSEETEFSTNFGEEHTTQINPSGDVVSLSVSVTIARAALAKHVKVSQGLSDDPTPAQIDTHLRELEQQLKRSVALPEEQVTVVAQAAAWTHDIYPQEEQDEPAVAGFFQVHAREIVLSILALLGCFMLYRVASRSVPALEPLPDPVADLQGFLKEKEERDRQRALEVESQDEEREAISWETTDEDRESLELLKAISEFAAERPDLAATVLRNWLNDTEESKEEDKDKEKA